MAPTMVPAICTGPKPATPIPRRSVNRKRAKNDYARDQRYDARCLFTHFFSSSFLFNKNSLNYEGI